MATRPSLTTPPGPSARMGTRRRPSGRRSGRGGALTPPHRPGAGGSRPWCPPRSPPRRGSPGGRGTTGPDPCPVHLVHAGVRQGRDDLPRDAGDLQRGGLEYDDVAGRGLHHAHRPGGRARRPPPVGVGVGSVLGRLRQPPRFLPVHGPHAAPVPVATTSDPSQDAGVGESREGRTPEPRGPVWMMLAAAVVALLGGQADLPLWPFG